MNDHERGFLEFLAEPGRRRMQTLLELGQKRRREVVSRLHHAVDLDPRYCQPITGADSFPAPIESLLRRHGAGDTCYVFGSKHDGREMPLGEALDAIVGMGNGAFVSCIPGRLGFFTFEDIKSNWLLVR